MTQTTSGRRGIGAFLTLAAASALCFSQPARADPPEMGVALQDFQRTCTAEIASYEAEMGQDAAPAYTQLATRYGLPGGSEEELASVEEVRQKNAATMAQIQQLRQESPNDVWIQRQMGVSAVMGECMFRVALRHAPGANGATQAANLSAPATPASDPTAGMTAEIAEAYRNTTDPAIRARIVRNAALYARSRPTLTVRANTGTRCVRPELTNYRLDAQTEQWSVTYRLTNTCSSEQFAEIEAEGGWHDLPNTGYFVATWDHHRDPHVGFTPYNPSGEIPHYRLSADQTTDGVWNHSATGGPNQIGAWIGSCPTHSPDGTRQIMFRPTAYMHDDPRVACVPAQNGRGF